MKIFCVFLFVGLFFNIVFSQNFSESQLIGSWKVIEVINYDSTSNKDLVDFFDDFKSSRFYFRQDGFFEFSSTGKSKAMIIFMQMFSGSNWIFDPEHLEIGIGNKKNKFNSAKIFVREKDNKVVFNIQESPITLIMEKQSREQQSYDKY